MNGQWGTPSVNGIGAPSKDKGNSNGELQIGVDAAFAADSAPELKFSSIPPSFPHLNPEQEGTESDPHVSAWTPQGMPEASPQVPDSRWSRVMEFHLLVMSM